jgi:hypothetical protein
MFLFKGALALVSLGSLALFASLSSAPAAVSAPVAAPPAPAAVDNPLCFCFPSFFYWDNGCECTTKDLTIGIARGPRCEPEPDQCPTSQVKNCTWSGGIALAGCPGVPDLPYTSIDLIAACAFTDYESFDCGGGGSLAVNLECSPCAENQ